MKKRSLQKKPFPYKGLLIALVIASTALFGTLFSSKKLFLFSPHVQEITRIDEPLFECPEYTGEASVEVFDNKPRFTKDEIVTEAFETYAPLDNLGRCGVAFANISPDTLPIEERGKIGNVRPSGWHSVKYEGIDGNFLFNRCHLIAYCLAGENAKEENLITGTRYLNIIGMLPIELKVLDYVVKTRMHVLYKVTPIFVGNELVARGVLIEAMSVEDEGEGLSFCVYCFNVQPGIEINYATGESIQIEVVYM